MDEQKLALKDEVVEDDSKILSHYMHGVETGSKIDATAAVPNAAADGMVLPAWDIDLERGEWRRPSEPDGVPQSRAGQASTPPQGTQAARAMARRSSA